MSLQNYDASLLLLAKHQEFAANMVFERAYCLYRTGKIEEALDVARAGSDSNGKDENGDTCQYVFACLQLQAQLHFRLGQSKEAIEAYERLFNVHNVQSLELKTNMVAAHVVAELSSKVPSLMSSMQVTGKQSFELGFNKVSKRMIASLSKHWVLIFIPHQACALIQSGQLDAAESELRMALKLGRESLLEEDLGEEEVAEELAPLTVQLGYVLGQMGRHDESAGAYEEVLANETITEEVVRAIAHNNVIAASGKVDGTHQQKKYVAAAARRVEGLLDKDKVMLSSRRPCSIDSRSNLSPCSLSACRLEAHLGARGSSFVLPEANTPSQQSSPHAPLWQAGSSEGDCFHTVQATCRGRHSHGLDSPPGGNPCCRGET